jgi:hypothetical protein
MIYGESIIDEILVEAIEAENTVRSKIHKLFIAF